MPADPEKMLFPRLKKLDLLSGCDKMKAFFAVTVIVICCFLAATPLVAIECFTSPGVTLCIERRAAITAFDFDSNFCRDIVIIQTTTT